MKTNTKTFDLEWSQTENNTINLAEIMSVPEATFQWSRKIEIQVGEDYWRTFEIPVRIIKEPAEEMSFDMLQELIEYWLASKKEFRFWNKVQKYLKFSI
jgi:hypothetical protein